MRSAKYCVRFLDFRRRAFNYLTRYKRDLRCLKYSLEIISVQKCQIRRSLIRLHRSPVRRTLRSQGLRGPLSQVLHGHRSPEHRMRST